VLATGILLRDVTDHVLDRAIPDRAAPAHSAGMSKPTRKILLVLTSHGQLGDTGKPTGAYLSEVAHPYLAFTEAGYEVDLVSPKGGRPPLDGVDDADAESKALLDDRGFLAKLSSTKRPAEVDAAAYAAIVYAGGHGTMWDFPDDRALAQLASAIDAQGGVVGAVCHGPAGLLNIQKVDGSYLIAGKKVAGFTNEEEAAVGLTKVVPYLLADALSQRGAIHQPAAMWAKQVVTDGRLVTGQNPQSARGVADAVLALL
jgi:putative intracellular protease/amidase